jgi:ATP-dependent helicase HrpB
VSFDPLHSDLPIVEVIPQLRKEFSLGNRVILSAPPGAGKSTLLPLAFLDQTWLGNKKIIMLEPRRLAARTVATRMASLLEEDAGESVGYRIRFENKISAKTKIEVVTEGILTRMLQSDNALEDVAMVIFDEFHERSIHADLALALCLESQKILRPDLKLLIMSATLNTAQLQTLLNAPLIESKGKLFPVEIKHGNDSDPLLLPELTARTVVTAVKENSGDALVFLPGEGEIKKCEEILLRELSSFSIHPLYGQLSNHEQQLAIIPNKNGKRKIVLATSIAETSLTIEGIKIVIDCGFSRVSKFDPRSGLSRLETVRLSKDSAHQRAGRAGRLSEGVCYRMWTMATEQRMAEHRVPEIMEADLASLLLDLYQWGVKNFNELNWISFPPASSISQAKDTLEQIGAIENEKLTEHGKEIRKLPCHPRIAHMLLKASDLKMQQLACDIAAVLEERDPLPRESGIDLNLRIEALRRARANNSSGGRFSRIEKVSASYRSLLKIESDNGTYDAYDTGILLAFAYPERIACARVGNNAQFQLANGKIAAAGHKDDLAHEAWLAVAHMDLRDGLGKIFLAAPLNPKDLLPMVKEVENISWDSRKGGIIALKELKIGGIVLQSKPISSYKSELMAEAISKAIANEKEQLIDLSEKLEQLQNRILSLQKWNGDQWPDVSTEFLLENNLQWLGSYLKDIKKTEDLKKLDLADCLFHSLEYDQQQKLNSLAPQKIVVPSGSSIGLKYFPNGMSPVLAVRLQEVFGMADTPAVNNGKNKVVMHLLSPGYKPVQVTSDLKSFWNNMYKEVKKEMQRRYPKHSWPDDPWTAPAVKKGRSEK